MKNERRQQLAQNSLAKFLEETVASAKKNSAAIFCFILVILIGVLLFLIWKNFSMKNKQSFTNDIKQLVAYNISSLDEEELSRIVTEYSLKYPSGVNNVTINIIVGDIYFNRGFDHLSLGKREKAINDFEKALEYYTIAEKFQFKPQDSSESAIWGLAQTNEALAALKEGDYFDTAKDYYEISCKTWPEGIRFELAAQQLAWLSRPLAATFREKYRDSDPALFAPDMQTPDLTTPIEELDMSILPGDFQSLLERQGEEVETHEYDPGFVPLEESQQATQEQKLDVQETTPVPNSGLDATL